jgi:hypothetical protein
MEKTLTAAIKTKGRKFGMGKLGEKRFFLSVTPGFAEGRVDSGRCAAAVRAVPAEFAADDFPCPVKVKFGHLILNGERGFLYIFAARLILAGFCFSCLTAFPALPGTLSR